MNQNELNSRKRDKLITQQLRHRMNASVKVLNPSVLEPHIFEMTMCEVEHGTSEHPPAVGLERMFLESIGVLPPGKGGTDG